MIGKVRLARHAMAALAASLLFGLPAAASPHTDVTDPLNHVRVRHLLAERHVALAKGAIGPSITLSVRLSLDLAPLACLSASQTSVTVTPGTAVNHCYAIQNTGDVALEFHDIVESDGGTIRQALANPVAPGGLLVISDVRVVTTPGTSVATWYARTAEATYSQIEGSCTFPQISPTGLPLNLADDGFAEIALPLPFSVYGIPRSSARVCNNGKLDFERNACVVTNVALPTATQPNSSLVFWDDLDSETGNVYFGPYNYSRPASARGVTSYDVVQWNQRSVFPGPSPSTATFAVGMIRPGQGLDGYQFFCYPDTDFDDPAHDFAASATIGINRDGALATQYSFNTSRPGLTGTFGIGFLPNNPPTASASASTTVDLVPEIFADGFES
jgi:hypothetical protein